jgi:hypothetical protein
LNFSKDGNTLLLKRSIDFASQSMTEKVKRVQEMFDITKLARSSGKFYTVDATDAPMYTLDASGKPVFKTLQGELCAWAHPEKNCDEPQPA